MADPVYHWAVGTAVNQEMPRIPGPQTGLSYTVEGLPEGVIFNPVTHRVTGTPVSKGRGDGSITAAAPAPSESTAVQNFRWTTTGLTFVGPAVLSFDIGETIDEGLPVGWPPFGVTYTVTGTFPAGTTYNATDHALQGTISAVGTGTIIIEGAIGTITGKTTINWEVSAALSISVTEMQFSWDTTQWINIQMPRTRNELTGTTYSISGLPVGIVYRDSDHRLVGSPIAAGSGTGTFTATLGSETTDIPLIWNVVASPITGTPNIYAFPRDPEPRGLFNIDVDTVSQTMRIGTLPDTFSRQMSLVDHEGILYGIHDREFWRVNVNNPADSVQIATLTIHVGHHTAARSYNGLIYIYTDTASYTLNPADIVDGMLAPVNLNQNPSGDFIHDGIELNGEYYYFDLINNQRWRVWKLNPANAAHSMDMGEFPEIGVDIGVAAIGGNIYIVGERTQVFGSPRDLLWRLPDIEDPGTVVLEGALPATGTHEFHFCQNMATFTAPPQAPSFYTDSIDFAWDTILEVDYALPRLLNEPAGTTYAVSGLPAGVTFDSTNHELEGTPDGDTTGLTGVGILTATVGTDTYTINLNWSIRYILQFAQMSIDIDAWPIGAMLNYMLPRALNEQMGTTYRISGDLPSGIMFDMADHTLEGTPRAPIQFVNTSIDVRWHVNDVITYSLPRILSEQPGTTYAITGLPTGMSYNATNHSLEGTPMATGTGTAVLTAMYQGQTTSIDLNWTVAQLLFANASVDVDWVQGVVVDYTLPRVEDEPVNIVYTVTGLPAGVTFNSGDHTLEGTPTTSGMGTAVLTGTVGVVSTTINIVWDVAVGTLPVYLMGSSRTLYRFDPSNPTVPVNLGTITEDFRTNTLFSANNNLYVLDNDRIMRINLMDVPNLVQAAIMSEDPSVQSILVANGVGYILDATQVRTFNTSDIASGSVTLTNLNVDPAGAGIAAVVEHNNMYYYADSQEYIYQANLADLAASVQSANSISGTASFSGIRTAMFSFGGTLYLSASQTLYTIDDPVNPVAVALGTSSERWASAATL